ncbi:knl-2, partial [Pristionchus pacificus]|uniref:Myb-like domain-containing protein n=1 Tax=Pristionchus pacificus TaxID=54126 RepID=A0A8R1Z6H5_PRIPA
SVIGLISEDSSFVNSPIMAPLGKHRQSLGVPRKKLSGSDTTVPGGKPPITLKLWIIKLVSGGVVVEGYRTVSENDASTLQNWRSTPIAIRIDSKTVQTHSGSIYKLKGGIEEEEAAEAGIPQELIDEFTSGFPENWEELIREHLHDQELARRRQSMNTASTIDTERDEEEERRASRRRSQRGAQDETMDTGEASDDEDRLRDAKMRRSMQKGRQSMMHRVQPGTPIEEDDEEEEMTTARGKTPERKNKAGETPLARSVSKKTPRGRGRTSQEDEEMGEQKEEEKTRMAPSTSRGRTRTPRGGKMTTKGREEEDDDDEVFTTPNEIPPVRARNLSVAIPQQRKEEDKTPHRPSFGFTHGRVSLDALPKEIMEKSIPLTRWVLRFVRGGTDKSIFPHFQFKILGFRPESEEQEWTTSAIQKVVPPYIMFTSSSIYRLDGQMDVDQATDIGFPRAFIQDFLLGFPDDWDERLELFFNKTFGPPPQPKIVEVLSDGGTVDDEKKNKKKESATPRNRGDGQNNRPNGPNFDFDDFEPLDNRKRTEPTPSSASSGEEKDEEEVLREARQMEKEMRRGEKAAELRAKAKEEKKKRFEVKVNTTPDGVAISRSGRTLRKPMAKWAGENVTYDVHGNVVDITGVTTTTKMTVGKTNEQQAEKLAAHFGVDSPFNSTMQKERAIAPPTACLPKTPAPKKSKADYKGYSDDETDGIPYKDYVKLLAAEDMATPAFNLKKGKRRCRAVESSDSEAEAEERRKEEKRRKKEERRRLRESDEEEESSDNGWRRKKKSKGKKKVTVKKEKQVKRAPSKKRKAKESEDEEEEGMGSDLEIEHDPDAVSFVLSDEGSNVERGNGYSDNEEIQSEEEEDEPSKKKNQKKTVKRAKVWKKEELTRLKLAIQAANPSGTPEGWENVAKSLGGERTAEECKKSAIERLKMKFNEPTMVESDGEYGSERAWSGAESGEASEDEEKKNRRNARLDEGNAVKGISAKPGTMAHAQEMEAMKRERLLGGRQSQDDFFKNTKTRMSGVAALPSVAVFDPDDSLLEALDDDDVAPAPKQRTTKTAKMAAAPATPRLAALSSFDDSPSGSATTSARRSSAKFVPSPVVNQNDLTRYVYQLSRTKNMSMLSKSAIDQSRMVSTMPPPLARGRMVARAAEAIDKGVSKVEKMKNGRRRDQMGDLDEDDENHDDILAGI